MEVVVIGLCAAAAAFLIYFAVSLIRDGSQPFVLYHVEYRLAPAETLPARGEELPDEPLTDTAAA